MIDQAIKFFESIQDPLLVIDREYKILYINKEGAAIYGKNSDRLTGKLCYAQLQELDGPCISCPMEPVFVLKKATVSERWLTLSDGRRKCGEIRSYPVFDASDKIIAATTIIVDITEKKAQAVKSDGNVFHLSKREKQVLKLISKGYTNPNIAGELGVSINTVKTHVVNIFNKIGVSDRTQAAIMALKADLI